MLFEWLGVSHILSDVRIGWEHGLMSGGYTALQGKVQAEASSPGVQSF